MTNDVVFARDYPGRHADPAGEPSGGTAERQLFRSSTQIYLTDERSARIAQLADDRHSSKAEIIRRILDEALGIGDEEDGARALIEATSGLCRDYPDWPEWLESARGRTADERLSSMGL